MKTVKYFTASWCSPCKFFKPTMKEIEREGYSIQFIDIDYHLNIDWSLISLLMKTNLLIIYSRQARIQVTNQKGELFAS